MMNKDDYLNIELTFDEYDKIIDKYCPNNTPVIQFINKGDTWVIKIVKWCLS